MLTEVNRLVHRAGEFEHAGVVDALFAAAERAVAEEAIVDLRILCVVAQVILELGEYVAQQVRLLADHGGERLVELSLMEQAPEDIADLQTVGVQLHLLPDIHRTCSCLLAFRC